MNRSIIEVDSFFLIEFLIFVLDFQIFEKYNNKPNKTADSNNALLFKKMNNTRTDWKSIGLIKNYIFKNKINIQKKSLI